MKFYLDFAILRGYTEHCINLCFSYISHDSIYGVYFSNSFPFITKFKFQENRNEGVSKLHGVLLY